MKHVPDVAIMVLALALVITIGIVIQELMGKYPDFGAIACAMLIVSEFRRAKEPA